MLETDRARFKLEASSLICLASISLPIKEDDDDKYFIGVGGSLKDVMYINLRTVLGTY